MGVFLFPGDSLEIHGDSLEIHGDSSKVQISYDAVTLKKGIKTPILEYEVKKVLETIRL